MIPLTGIKSCGRLSRAWRHQWAFIPQGSDNWQSLRTDSQVSNVTGGAKPVPYLQMHGQDFSAGIVGKHLQILCHVMKRGHFDPVRGCSMERCELSNVDSVIITSRPEGRAQLSEMIPTTLTETLQ